MEVYGSYATDLLIESSDIDIAVRFNENSTGDMDSLLNKLSAKINAMKSIFENINIIPTASVPVIKIVLVS